MSYPAVAPRVLPEGYADVAARAEDGSYYCTGADAAVSQAGTASLLRT